MQQWDVYEINQQWPRSEGSPRQALDPTPKPRMFVIVADPCGRPYATCCPIQNAEKGIFTGEVPLTKNSASFITKDCKIVCFQLFTFESVYFRNLLGALPKSFHQDVKDSLITIFDL